MITIINKRTSCFAFAFFLACSTLGTIQGQTNEGSNASEKSLVTMPDVTLWRNHSVTLSNDGNWHSVEYRPSTSDKFEDKQTDKESADEPDQKKQEQLERYGKGALNDVLYIRNSDGSKEFEIERGKNPQFSNNSEWVAYSISKEKKKDEKSGSDKTDGKQKQTPPLVIELRSLNDETLKRWEIKTSNSSRSLKFPEDSEYFILHSKSGLLLFDLRDQSEHYIGNVGEYHLSKDSSQLFYTIKTDDRNGNGIYVFDVETRSTRTLTSASDVFSSLTFLKNENALAAFQVKSESEDKKSSDEKTEEKPSPNVNLIVIKNPGSEQPELSLYAPKELEGIPEDTSLLTTGLEWSEDGNRVFLRLEQQEEENPDTDSESSGDDDASTKNNDTENDEATDNEATDDEENEETGENDMEITAKGNVDVWHWKDEKLQSQQMKEGGSARKQVFDFVLDLNKRTLIQLTDEDLRISEKSRDGQWAIATNSQPYISDWDVRRSDVYRVNLVTGERKLLLERHNGQIQMLPHGTQVIYWKNRHFWVYSFEEDTHLNVTSRTPISFVNTDYDYHGAEPAFGVESFANDGTAVILNHRHDLWLQPLNGEPATCLTQGMGEEKKIRFSLAIPPNRRDDDLELEERYVDLSQPVMLRGAGSLSKKSGIFRLASDNLETLVYEDSEFNSLRKAEDADVATFKRGDYQHYPETFLSDLSFQNPKQLTRTNQHQEKYRWGRRILVDYTNKDGRSLQGILSIPDSYQDGNPLPMIVYSYEKLSNGMHRYPTPRIPGAGVSEMMYVSDDYLYLQPDIHFRKRTSHSDMHECIDAAIQKVIELGYADEERVGYIGHSYGGHAAMFMSTQENRFAAIAGGAGVSNLIQGFNIDIVSDGSNEQDYYISGQGRLTRSPADDLGLYIDQSPVFHAKNMETPLLLYHGTADNVVPWEHSFGFYNLLRFLKKPVILLSYRGEGHGMREFENRKDLQLRLKEFFDHHLKGQDAPKWIEEGVPFEDRPEDSRKDSERTLPPWK